MTCSDPNTASHHSDARLESPIAHVGIDGESAQGGEPVSAETSGARQVSRDALLQIREREWRPRLRGVSLVAEAEISEEHRTQAASALGVLYSKGNFSAAGGYGFLTRWPACLVAAMTGVAVTSYAQGTYWPALWEAAGYKGSPADQQVWGRAFTTALTKLGLPSFTGTTQQRYIGPILMHAGIPAYCLGDLFRLLVERRRQDPRLDADAFLAWATAPGRGLRLSELDVPVRRFLLSGGEYAHDIIDRILDLLERLTEPDPDLDGVGLPAYMTQTARDEVAKGYLDVSGTRRSAARTGTGTVRQSRPRIALDPYGTGVHVLLPAVGDMPDGVARWHVTADGKTGTVQSRALWVGAAEAAPETAYSLSRPVRTVLVSLVGREDLATELMVIDQADPVLFFAEDGRRLPGSISLPRAQVWVMHPADRELEIVGRAAQGAESAVPFGWDGWKLLHLSLQDVQVVGLRGGRAHEVEFQARPQLLHGEPTTGVTTPYGSPVYAELPTLLLPPTNAEITWRVDIRRVGDTTPTTTRSVSTSGEIDIWQDVPRPVLGAFEVTVRGPLGRGLRRPIVIAEGLTVSYLPKARLLTGTGLAQGRATLTADDGATVSPRLLSFAPGERSHPVEYRTATESEPLVITPPHAALLCPGASVTTWTTSLLHLVSEDFAAAGRLLVRLPVAGQHSQLTLEVYAGGQRVQSIAVSGQQSFGQAGFDLGRAADTIADYHRAELVLDADGVQMPVGYVRPRLLASGAHVADGTLVLHDAVAIDGLTVGVYLGFAPWRSPVELPVGETGTVPLPEGLMNAGPLSVLVRVDDPWAVSSWPAWPGVIGYECPAPGLPSSADPEEECLSRFLAGEAELPVLTSLGRLWHLVHLASQLVRLGARADLAEQCTTELRRRPRAALLALAGENFSHGEVVRRLITTGLAAAPGDSAPWQPAERALLERLWGAFPAAAVIAGGSSLASPVMAELAVVHCGDSLGEMLAGRPDPHGIVGRFGRDAEMMALLPPEQVEALWQAAAVVPQALLDVDTRASAARRMFDARNTPPMRAAAMIVKTVSRAAELMIVDSSANCLVSAIRERLPREGKSGWLGLPAMSIAMALTARLAARGNARCAVLEQEYRGKWSNLAFDAPELVAIDLVRAEAMLVGILNKRLEENPHEH